MKLFARIVNLEDKLEGRTDYDMTMLVMAESKEEADLKTDKALNEYIEEFMDTNNDNYKLVFDSHFGAWAWLLDENDYTVIRPESLYE